ncbi:hypothetical protein WR25_05407 [Diploscapter pachys]|uniref:Calpain catalytic domain-containing protein n=1 Tax=Diploscapter pachys TaxID=2018661 RepID=A0A2A2KA17_9BILA|nr:hypothetical protein WR25_05407 [Diploscapter pachys]
MSWHCPLCTLENRLESPHCQACLSENPALARKPSPSMIPQFISKNVEGFSQAMKGIISSAADIAAKAAEKIISPTADFHHDVIVLPNGPVVPNPVHPKPPNPMSAVQPYNLNMDMSLSPRQSEEEVRNFDENVVWNCTACTAENQGSSQQCSFCGNQRTVGSKRHNRRANSTFYLNSPHSSRDRADSSEDSQNKSLNPNSEEFDAKMCSDITEEVIKRDKRRSEKIYKHIVETCERLKAEFVDPDFPHSKKSIGDLRRHENEAIVGQIPDHFEWLRPSRIYTKEGRAFPWAVFRDPRPSDIEQGSLGDCWLLSAMALIAERPDILEQIVLTKQYSEIGVYQVRVCVDGEWCTVTIDDSFPCNSRSLSLAFARGRKNQLWVPLIEKALAKHLGSYAKLRGGRTLEGLAMLTGAPCEVISLEKKNLDREMLWAQLISAHEASFIMGCSCGSGRRHADENAYKSKGLLTRHAYSILDVRQEGQNRLVHIRNPWGSHVWTGDWSDRWPGWPPNLRQRLLSRENHGSGAFWISFDDFISYFDSVDVAKIRTYAGWAELRVPLLIGGHSEKNDKVVQLIITEPTEINISLYQKGARTVDDQNDLMVSLHKVSATGKVSDLVARSRREIRAFVSTGNVNFPSSYGKLNFQETFS